MNIYTLRFFLAGACLAFCYLPLRGSCVDSAKVNVQPVQCHGLRNGAIDIDTVFGGERPFFFSIDGSTYSTRPLFDHLWAGEYTLYIKDASDSCVWSQTFLVSEPELLQAKILTDKSMVEAGEPLQVWVEVEPEHSGWYVAEWRPPFLFSSPSAPAQIVYPIETVALAVEVRDQNGCIARDQAPIQVEKTNVYTPNVILPGSSQDAFFTVFAGEGVRQVQQLQVYSRGGGLVFERLNFPANDPINGWNGRWRGRFVQPGVYLWLATVEFHDGRHQRYQGTVTVVR